jgi:hypothetical protein
MPQSCPRCFRSQEGPYCRVCGAAVADASPDSNAPESRDRQTRRRVAIFLVSSVIGAVLLLVGLRTGQLLMLLVGLLLPAIVLITLSRHHSQT